MTRNLSNFRLSQVIGHRDDSYGVRTEIICSEEVNIVAEEGSHGPSQTTAVTGIMEDQS